MFLESDSFGVVELMLDKSEWEGEIKEMARSCREMLARPCVMHVIKYIFGDMNLVADKLAK